MNLYINRFGQLCEISHSPFGLIMTIIGGIVNPYYPNLNFNQVDKYFFRKEKNTKK